MAKKISDKLYTIHLFNRSLEMKTYVDLVVMDSDQTIYAINTINTDQKQELFKMAMREKFKTGTIFHPEHNKKDYQFTIYTLDDRDAYDLYEYKLNDLNQVLYVSKLSKPVLKDRQAFEKAFDEAIQKKETPPKAPKDFIVAWDGNLNETIFQTLYDRYNTPMLKEWADYIVDACKQKGYVKELTCYAFGRDYTVRAAILTIAEKQLETIIQDGIQSMDLDFALMEDGRSDDEGVLSDCTALDDYLTHFATDLGDIIQKNSKIRFDPTKEAHHESFYHLNLNANQRGVTGLYPQQADAVMGCVKTLKDDKYVFLIGEMGE